MKDWWERLVEFVRQHPKGAIWIALLLLVLSNILVLLFDLWFYPVLGVGIVAYVLYDEYKTRKQHRQAVQNQQAQAATDQRCWIIRQAICDVVNAVIRLLPGVFAPMGIEDIPIRVVVQRGIMMYLCTIPHLPGVTLESDKVLKYLDARMYALLLAGRLRDIHCVTWDGKFPFLKLDQLDDTGTAYTVSIVVDDNQAASDYLTQRQFEQEDPPALPPPPVDSEF